ncbi:hypothetical protein FHX42_001986 [Saccharopolyspora lacisalsi]|uniref:DUF6314 domain-containing protein n=1 Tax=Halosaccharopolyspora lacisalsi TaxID=1000566 RepID=A0A839DV46_9PSEU|nr:DUF6314 family protein [Halosaccharopolyspora lacisalsi]MBA8824639.1 hypothetical protein [Halosaccharopolyspora lacisalsi]
MGGWPVFDLADYLGGHWRLDRGIRDGAGAELGTFAGTAEVTVEGSVLVYDERGTLDVGTYRGPAHRRLRYRITGPGLAEVYFDYGDFFHDLDLREGWWRTRHPCREDLYRGEFHVHGRHEWEQAWTVAGPTKNYAMTTRLRRAGAP